MSEERAVDDACVVRPSALVFEEFEEGDPRRGPHTPEERAEAAAYMMAPNRWHRLAPGVDWFAVWLQYGRGFNALQLARRFDIGDSTISNRKRDEHWVSPMSERDRRKLSMLVWLAGIARGAGESEASREALKASSEWRLPEQQAPPRYRPYDPNGAPQTVTFINEFPDDAYYTAADPKRDDRIAMRSKLDELIARMERDVARGITHPEGKVVSQLAGDQGGADGSEADRARVEPLDEPGTDPAHGR